MKTTKSFWSVLEGLAFSAVLFLAMWLTGCNHDPVDSGEESPIATVDPAVTELIGFNDVGHAFWNEDGQGFVWDGSEVHTLSFEIPEWPFQLFELGPGGAVAGDGIYWKNGEMMEVGGASGIDGEGRVYVGNRWWDPVQDTFTPAPSTTGLLVDVGENGAILFQELAFCTEPPFEECVPACFYSTLESTRVFTSSSGEGCSKLAHVTENGLIIRGRESTQVYDTNTDPWTMQEFDFASWTMNDQMIFVTTQGQVRDADGNVIKDVDAVHALINNRNEVLMMSPEGEIRIVKP